MSIKEKVIELLEEVNSSEEIINSNVADWDERKLDRTAGAFTTDEVTDTENLDCNRINHEIPMEISNHANPENEIETTSIFIGVSESNFVNSVKKMLKEQDWEGVKAWNPDLRISANQVKRALDSACPGVLGIQVEEELVGERGEGIAFNVTGGVDWDQYGKDQQLPKKLDVENVQLELVEEPEEFDHGIENVSNRKKYLYKVTGTNSVFPIITDDAL